MRLTENEVEGVLAILKLCIDAIEAEHRQEAHILRNLANKFSLPLAIWKQRQGG